MDTSSFDDIAKDLAPIYRKLKDVNIDLLGTKCELLRIIKGEEDDFGDFDETLDSVVINNVILENPFRAETRLFDDYDSDTMQLNIASIDIFDFLPINLKVLFEGDGETESVAIKSEDLLVDILEDEHGNKIPLVYQVMSLRGEFSNKYLIGKKYQLVLYRGALPPMIKNRILAYINGEI